MTLRRFSQHNAKRSTRPNPQPVDGVEEGSPAWEAGVRPGMTLLTVNGRPVLDALDYRYREYEEKVSLVLRDTDGSLLQLTVEKEPGVPLGMDFSGRLMDDVRVCANRCIFCFVDQEPPTARDTMLIKDDDWRLSAIAGNFVTLTNLREGEFERIIRERISPLYISVHATDPETRVRMMGNRNAGKILEQLKALAAAGIEFHLQIVLCPGYNDGEILDRSLHDLALLRPAAKTLAVVPIGLTGWREGLAPIEPVSPEGARAAIAAMSYYRGFCFGSDELYIRAGVRPPDPDEYGSYPQFENGVGMVPKFLKDFREAAEGRKPRAEEYTIVTGELFAPVLDGLLKEYGVPSEVVAAKNIYFGGAVNVAGLLTGSDIAAALSGREVKRVLLCENMLRKNGNVFLDNMTLDELRAKTGAEIYVSGQGGAELAACLMQQQEEDDG